ncbi:MAG: hypothetical protein WC499_03885 [Patescibacteria group bacterium]
MQKDDFFTTNPHKSISKVTINSFMMGSLFFVLTLIITLSPERFSPLVIYQLVLAIPLLFVSSLAYSKIGYWKETSGWNTLGWFTNNIGNLFVINAIGIVAAKFNLILAYVYFSIFSILMIIYTLINIKYNKKKTVSKIFKLIFLLVIIFLGGILPLI